MTGSRSRRRALVLIGSQVILLGVILAAARSTSAESQVREQIVWLDVAVVAAVGSAAVNGGLLVGVRRSVSLRQRDVLDVVEARIQAAPEVVIHDPAMSESGRSLVSIPGLRLAHRPACALVAGRQTVPARTDQEPCGWCCRG